MSHLGTSRYGVDSAPGNLAVVQELLNTASAGNPRMPDLLHDPELATKWIAEVRKSASTDEPFDAGGHVSEADLRKMRSLRETMTAAVTGSQAKSVRGDVALTIDSEGHVAAAESGRPLNWLYSTVLLESLLAQRSGDWRRLKVCANPDCAVSFYDRSKNRSGVWHDVHVCGNAINLRASRSRRREMTANPNS